MKSQRLARTRVIGGVAGLATAATILLIPGLHSVRGEQKRASGDSVIFNLQSYLDRSGLVATYSENGNISRNSAFFQSLGTNGRSCATCHVASQAFSVSVREVRHRYAASRGRDPLFASVDGANCPGAEPSDEAAHSLLLKHGLIRIGLAAPAGSPQFSAQPEYDPYGCAIDNSTGEQVLSFYRRPLPTTNLRFLSAVMFDGRESSALPLNNPATFEANLKADLTAQALHAVQGHAQSTADPTPAQLAEIVKLELGLSTAQFWDFRAGLLSAFGAKGGPVALTRHPYSPGINDSLTVSTFDPTIFTLFEPWTHQQRPFSARETARAEILSGEQIFNSFPIHITDVRGLNDNPALGNRSTITGTCGTCHDTPSVGNHSLPLPLDIGTGHSPRYETNPQISNALAQLSFPDLPVYRVIGCTDPFTGEATIYTTDLGKAMLTGQCADLNRIKGPVLRGLAARAPYFHNGAAADLKELVNFYNERFNMGLTDQQKTELAAFLNSL